MNYFVEREIDEHWYPVPGPTKSNSAFQAVAHAALTEGIYRARPVDHPGTGYELFSVPSWGQPIPLNDSPEPSFRALSNSRRRAAFD